MSSGRVLWIVGFAFATTGCLGGQSGTEGSPSPNSPGGCSASSGVPVGLDEVTAAGVARTVVDRLRSPQIAALSWNPPDGTSPAVDTTLTLTVSGQPAAATYEVAESSAGTCLPVLRVTGVTLRFETADGAFNESFVGVVSHSSRGDEFSAMLPISDFSGNYAIALAGQAFHQPLLRLDMSFSPARGKLDVVDDSTKAGSVAGAVAVANWTGVEHAP